MTWKTLTRFNGSELDPDFIITITISEFPAHNILWTDYCLLNFMKNCAAWSRVFAISLIVQFLFNFRHPLCLLECWFLTTKATEHEAFPNECSERTHVIVQIPSRANSWVVVMETFQGVTYDLPAAASRSAPSSASSLSLKSVTRESSRAASAHHTRSQ